MSFGIILPHRWTRQPQGPVELDPQFGFEGIWTPYGCVTGPQAVEVATKKTISRSGLCWEQASLGCQVKILENSSSLTTQGITVVMQLYTASTTVNGEWGVSATGSAARCGGHVPYTDGTVYFDFGGATEGVSRISQAGLSFGLDDVWVFTSGARGMEIWQNGILRKSNSGNPTRTASTAAWGLGPHDTTPSNWGGKCSVFAYANEQAPSSLCRDLSLNPYILARPIQRRIYVPSAGGATAYTLTADSGSFPLSGTAAGLALGRQLSAEASAFTLSGTAAGLAHGRAITAEAGAFTLTGTAAGLAIGRQLSAEAGSFALTGADATLEWSGAGAKTIDAESGTFALTGTAVGLALGRKLVAEAGSFTLTGTAATLTHGYTLVAENGDFVVTGSDAALSTTGTVVIEPSKGAGGKRTQARRRRILEEADLTPEQREAMGLPPAEPPQLEAAPNPPKRAKRTGKASRGIQLAPEAVAPSADEMRAAEILAQRTAELMAQQQAMRAEGMAMLQAAAAIEAENEMIMLLLMAA